MIIFPDISPEIFSVTIGGVTLALRWYALAYIAGLIIGWRMVVAAMKRPALWGPGGAPMRPEQVEDLLTWVILGVIIGGRLGFVMFYQPAYYLSNPLEIPMLWQGGMSFHGGFIGVVAAAAWFFRRNAIPMLPAADALALATPPGLLLGRLANFINAELWGRQTDMPWGVVFPGDSAQFCPEVAGLCARHPSQLYEAILEGLLLGALLIWLAWRRGGLRAPGLLTGIFLIGYGGARFFVEFFRQPDLQFVTLDNPVGHALSFGGGYGLTMGQLLSLPMIAVGLWLALRARRKGTAAA